MPSSPPLPEAIERVNEALQQMQHGTFHATALFRDALIAVRDAASRAEAAERDGAAYHLAPIADCVNTWHRELGLTPIDNPHPFVSKLEEVRGGIDEIGYLANRARLDANDLRSSLAAAERELEAAYGWISRSPRRSDGACVECYPHEEKPEQFRGFVCAWHMAQRAAPHPTGTKEDERGE